MTTTKNNKDDGKPVHLRLLDLDEDELKELNYYQLLGLDEPVRATPYTIKQAYRKASIRYHPDKTGLGDNDHVFIAVKAAWDTLSDPALRKAYDSTEMPFDDSIPPDVAAAAATWNNGTSTTSSVASSSNGSPPNGTTTTTTSLSGSTSSNNLLYTDDDFFDTFGPVFERNLRFDTRLQEQTSKKGATEIPTLGEVDTPIEQVQAFYGTVYDYYCYDDCDDCFGDDDCYVCLWFVLMFVVMILCLFVCFQCMYVCLFVVCL